MKSFFVIIIGIIAFLVLCIPDPFEVIPLVGALDEATATAVILACARYFGFDLSKFFGRKGDKKEDSEVIDVK